MSSSVQTFVALLVVTIAATLLLRSWFGKKKSSGCSNEGCAAVSPEIKRLQARLKR